jgi:hypothetical protein
LHYYRKGISLSKKEGDFTSVEFYFSHRFQVRCKHTRWSKFDTFHIGGTSNVKTTISPRFWFFTMWNVNLDFILLKTYMYFTSASHLGRCEKSIYHIGELVKPMWNLFFCCLSSFFFETENIFLFRFWCLIFHIFSCITHTTAETTFLYLKILPYHHIDHKHIYTSNKNSSKLKLISLQQINS